MKIVIKVIIRINTHSRNCSKPDTSIQKMSQGVVVPFHVGDLSGFRIRKKNQNK